MANVNTQKILDKIFLSDFFKNTDTAPLIQQYDTRTALRKANTTIKSSASPLVQTGTDISSIPPGGILISTSGQYQFSGNITWSPTGPGTAITISASDVVLDMKGYTLSAAIPDTTLQYKGISLAGSNITLQDGTIRDMTYYGLYASSAPGLQLNNIIVNGINYTGTSQAFLTPSGIYIDKTDGFIVQNCTVQNTSVIAPSCAGIQVIESLNGTISGCTLNNFVNHDGAVQGFSYLLCANIATSNCSAENFQSHYLGQTVTSGHTVLGFIPIFCVDLVYDTCSSTNMTGCCDDCHGMSVFLDAFVEVNNFSALNVTDGVTPRNTGAKATGLEVYGIGITLNNCTVENITAIVPQDLQSAGFSAWGLAITFNNCTAINVKVTDPGGIPSTQYGYGTGFGWAPDPRKEFKNQPASFVQYNSCVSKDCQLGFDTWFHTDSVWQNVNASGCPVFMLIQPPGTPRTLRIDKCSESPNGQYQQVTLYNIAKNLTYCHNDKR